MSEFAAAIRKLGEAEWKCPARLHILNAEDGSHLLCQNCGSADAAGRIMLFAALRVECPCQNIYVGNMEPSLCYPCLMKAYRENVDGDHTMAGHGLVCSSNCERCQGRGWIPEPDIEKACWRIFKIVNLDYMHLHNEEAVIRAALAWLEEQHDQAHKAGGA